MIPTLTRSPTFPRALRRPRSQQLIVSSAADVYAALADIRYQDREHFIAFHLSIRHRLLRRRTVHIGTLTTVECHPREIFRGAILGAAAAIIVATTIRPATPPHRATTSPSPTDSARSASSAAFPSLTTSSSPTAATSRWPTAGGGEMSGTRQTQRPLGAAPRGSPWPRRGVCGSGGTHSPLLKAAQTQPHGR